MLHWAAINNRTEIVKYLIAKGANVDAIGGELASTPLHWATRFVIDFFLFKIALDTFSIRTRDFKNRDFMAQKRAERSNLKLGTK